MDVDVDQAVADQQRALQPVGEVDRRAAPVGGRIRLRLVEDVRRVLVVVVRPVGHRPQRGAGGEHVRRREHRHQRDEAAVAAAIDAEPPRRRPSRRHQPVRAVDDVVEIGCRPCGDRSRCASRGRSRRCRGSRDRARRSPATRAGGGTCTRGSSATSSGARSAASRRRARRPPPARRSALRADHLRRVEARAHRRAVARLVGDDARRDPLAASHSGVGLVVTDVVAWSSAAAARCRSPWGGARNTSGGRVADDDSSAHVAPSGDGSIACAPGAVVSRVRAPPSTGSVYTCRSPASASVDTMRNCLPSGVSCASVISQAPLVSCLGVGSAAARSAT